MLAAFSILLFAGHNLPYTGMWYDESIQFWISRAVSPFAAPHSHAGDLGDVLALNAGFNLDPGGFSVLLHYWMSVDTGLAWLRLLPYLFFLLGLACLGRLAHAWSGSAVHAVLSVGLVWLFDVLLYHAVEIRAYSMEFAGVMALLLCAHFALRHRTPGWFFVLGLAAAFFLTSRYSFVFIVAALGLTLASFVARDRERTMKSRIALLAWFAAPVIVVAGLILFLSLRGQIETWMGGSLVDQGAPQYVRHAVLADKPLHEAIALALRNLFSWKGIPITLAAASALLLAVPRLTGRESRRSVTVFTDGEKQGLATIAFALGISIAVSALGFYPWDIDSKWSQYLLALSPVAISIFTSALFRHARENRTLPGASVPLVSALALVVLALASLNAMRYRHIYWLDLRAPLLYLSAVANGDTRVAVWGYEEPTVKYLFEFGPLRNKPVYPSGFAFKAWQLTIDEDCLGYVLSPQPRDALRDTFPGIELHDDPAYPTLLHRVAPPGPRCPDAPSSGS